MDRASLLWQPKIVKVGATQLMVNPSEIVQIAAERAFGSRLVTNSNRGLIVEAIVSTVLCPEWHWCSEDYHCCDFMHPSGTQLEVKQSAASQSWKSKVPTVARWDVGTRKGYWEGDTYVARPGRNAEIYVLAWHPVTDREQADHRDPAQWQFFVVQADALPPVRTLGMAGVAALATPVRVCQLASTVSNKLSSSRPR